MSERYELDDKRRERQEDAIERREEQSEGDLRERIMENPSGEGTISEKIDQESVTGGHGHGGQVEEEIDEVTS